MYAASGNACLNLDSSPFHPRTDHRKGPDCMLERFEWASRMWGLLSPSERDRLIHNLMRLRSSTHFSGLGGFELILASIAREVNRHLLHGVPTPRSTHACDKEASRRRVLIAYDDDHRPHHVMDDILDRLPEEDKKAVLATVPLPKDGMSVRREKNEKGRKLIFDVYNNKGHLLKTSFCSLHGRQCPLFRKEGSAFRSESESDADDDEDFLEMHAAGVICKDASAQGAQTGDCGPFMHLQHMWTAERRVRQEDFILVECTPRWEAKSVVEHFPMYMQGHTAVLNTSEAGEQVRRDRRELTLYNSERVFFFVDCHFAYVM